MMSKFRMTCFAVGRANYFPFHSLSIYLLGWWKKQCRFLTYVTFIYNFWINSLIYIYIYIYISRVIYNFEARFSLYWIVLFVTVLNLFIHFFFFCWLFDSMDKNSNPHDFLVPVQTRPKICRDSSWYQWCVWAQEPLTIVWHNGVFQEISQWWREPWRWRRSRPADCGW